MRIGMDFGTTNSGIAHYDGDQLRLLPLDPAAPNPAVARTALYLTHDRQLHFGQSAIQHYYEQNLNRPVQLERVHIGEIELTFAELPTFLRDVYIERDVFSPGRLFLSFKSSLPSQGYLGTAVGEDYYLLEDIIALYLYSARRRAEQALDAELTEVVLGRPVRYSDDPEQDALAQARMLQAAFLAGFQRVHFAYEPVAAAYAYTLRPDFHADTPQTLLVFDFGGGTLDISIVKSETVRSCEPGRATAPQLTVLATGGIAIAGDAFDSRIVRNKLTDPFGEDSHYRSDGRLLPVPAAYYDAFSSWQDLLTLQQPNTLESLRRIARSAEQPARIHSLIRLITSHYGLRLFDIAESAKRHLSTDHQARLQLNEDGLALDERLSRREFERLIRPDLRQISARLDEVLAAANLRPDQIDAVLRTGGSAQIPCFVALLEERFGAAKVRSMDTFSSVTAGLAVIAQRLSALRDGKKRLSALRDGKKRLDVDLPEGVLASADHTPESHAARPAPAAQQLPRVPALRGRKKRVPALRGASGHFAAVRSRKKRVPASYRETKASERLPRVPLQQMQQLIDLRGRKRASTANLSWLIGRGADGQMVSVPLPQELPASLRLAECALSRETPKSFSPPVFALSPPARILPADERLVLLTSAPRLLAREVGWLYELDALGTTLAEFERFERDAFGEERVCSFSAWSDLADARRLLLLTTRARVQPLATESTLQRLRLSASLRLELPARASYGRGGTARASYGREGTARAGDPLALLPLHEGGSLILLTSAGRLARLSVEDCEATGTLSPTGGALLSLAGRTRLAAAFMLRGAGQLVVAREDGALRWWESDEIPLAGEWRMALRGGVASLTAAKGRHAPLTAAKGWHAPLTAAKGWHAPLTAAKGWHALAVVEEGRTLWALTTQRLLTVAARTPVAARMERIDLRCGEQLLGFVNG